MAYKIEIMSHAENAMIRISVSEHYAMVYRVEGTKKMSASCDSSMRRGSTKNLLNKFHNQIIAKTGCDKKEKS